MNISAPCSEDALMAEQTANTSTPRAADSKLRRNNYQRRSFWIQAKRIFRKRLLLRKSRKKVSCIDIAMTEFSEAEVGRSSEKISHELLASVLQLVYPYLNIYDRIRLRRVCRVTEEIFQQSLISLPPIKLQAASLDDIEIWADHSDLIVQLLVPELDLASETGQNKIIVVKDWQAELIVQRIVSRVDRIEHLWLETAINGELCSALLKGTTETGPDENPRWRTLKMDKLTVVGSDEHDCEVISKVVSQFAQSLRELCFRHICMDFGLFCEEFWEAIKLCSHLRQFQYQTCRLDSFSHVHLHHALNGKNLTSLELGGIEHLSAAILSRIISNAPIRNLAIIAPRIKFESYLEGNIGETLKRLSTLLVQCTASFELSDIAQRECVIKVLTHLSKDGVLEVVHVTWNSVAEAARIMSYWLEIAKDTKRNLKLKLSGISQNRMDQAVGRLLRKCGNVFKSAIIGSSLVLTLGEGSICILDKYTWFGENDD